MKFVILVQTGLMCVLAVASVQAGLGTEALKGVGKAATRELGQETLEAGAKTSAKRLAQELAAESAESVARSGGKTVLLGAGDDLVRAASGLNARNARRLQMLAGEIEQSGRGPELLALIGKDGAGDQVMEFLWRNKGTLVGGAAVSALLLNPEAALAAGSDVANTMIRESAEHVAQPMIEGTMAHVAAPVIAASSFWVGLLLVLFLIGSGVLAYLRLKKMSLYLMLMRKLTRCSAMIIAVARRQCHWAVQKVQQTIHGIE